jgi:hypothetical protein
VKDWIDNPLSFFSKDIKLCLDEDPVAHACGYLSHIGNRSEDLDLARQRFLKVTLHRLRQRLGVERLRSGRVDRLAMFYNHFGHTEPAKKEEIAKWLDEGSRLDSICQELEENQPCGYSYLSNLFYMNDITDRR